MNKSSIFSAGINDIKDGCRPVNYPGRFLIERERKILDFKERCYRAMADFVGYPMDSTTRATIDAALSREVNGLQFLIADNAPFPRIEVVPLYSVDYPSDVGLEFSIGNTGRHFQVDETGAL